MSYPLRVRGLKSVVKERYESETPVVPLEGTWIEIEAGLDVDKIASVVPLEGTWIEIKRQHVSTCTVCQSYPLRVRGLK